MQLTDERGSLVGALVVDEDDQVMAIMRSGKVIRSDVSEVKRTGRTTQGVTLAKPDKGDVIISIARNAEQDDDETDEAPEQSEKGQSQPVETVQTGPDGE